MRKKLILLALALALTAIAAAPRPATAAVCYWITCPPDGREVRCCNPNPVVCEANCPH